MKLGDAISAVATPIARAWGLDCIDPATGQLHPDSGCARRRDALNHLSDAFYDAFWPTTKQKETKDAIRDNETNSG